MPATKAINRTELYRLVWTEPISRIAPTYGLSDVGLAKLCKRYDIPRPPRGYWAQLQHGHKPRQIPLPKPEYDPEIQLREVEPAAGDAAASGAPEAPEAINIIVADTLRGCHDLVSRANQELQAAETNSDGLIVAADNRTLDVRTSKVCARRALLILDALLKECERRGYSVAAGPTIGILEHSMRIGIHEAVDIERKEAEPDDLRGPYSFGYGRFDAKRVPSGRLVLAITDGRGYWADGSRSTWRDTDTHRLEEYLGKVLVALVKLAERARQYKAEQQRQAELRRQEEEREREAARQLAERRKQYKAEKARVKELLKQAANLRRSRQVRELIEAVRQQHEANGPIAPDSEIAAWIEWATRQADRLDPLRPSPPSILDEDLEEKPPPRQPYQRPDW